MPEPEYFLQYRMRCNVQNFVMSGKIHVQVLSMVLRHPLQWCMVLRRRKTVVRGKCALLSAVLVQIATPTVFLRFSRNVCQYSQTCGTDFWNLACKIFDFFSNHYSIFTRILTKLDTCDLCTNMQNSGMDFLKFCFKNFWQIFQISNWDLQV